MDGKRFPLKISAHLLFVIYTDIGLELGYLESITFMEKRSDRKPDGKVILMYSRVLLIDKAIEQCKSDKDHHVTSRNETRRISSLGANSLRKLLAKQKEEGKARLVFHRGDFPFETSAENVVGFVAWQSGCNRVDGASSNDDPKSFLAKINASLRLDLNPSELKLGSLSEIDTVILGTDFSEPVFNND